MFYYHTIKIYNIIGVDKSPRGVIKSPVISEVAELQVDIQNVNVNKLKRVYGIDTQVSFEIYSPICSEIKEGSIIEYNDTYYQVDRVILWDEYAQDSIFESYMQFVVSKYEGQLKVEEVTVYEG